MFRVVVKEPEKHFELEIQKCDDALLPLDIESIDEKELTFSNKIRNKVKRIAWALYRNFREQTRIYNRSILHNLGGTQLQIRQTIERYTRKMDYGTSFLEKVRIFSSIIKNSPEKFAEDLLFLEQRSVDLDAQLIGMNLLIGKDYEPELTQIHPLDSLILRCAQPFLEILHTNGIRIELKGLENKKIRADFRLFNCAMYHFFDNVRKYTQSDTQINVYTDNELKKVIFDMRSRALEAGEDSKIFQEGFCGKNSKDQKGEGLGMFVFYSAVKKMGGIPDVHWDDLTRISIDNNPYQRNMFSIEFPRGVIINNPD